MRYRAWRFPCNHPVIIYSRAGRGPAVIINVSPEGARLAQGPAAQPGEIVRVELGPGCIPREAEVRWASAGKLGLRFRHTLGAREMAVIRSAAGHTPLQGPGAQSQGPPRELQ